MSLPYLSGEGLIFFPFLLCVGPWLCWYGLISEGEELGVSLSSLLGVIRRSVEIVLPSLLCKWLWNWIEGCIGNGAFAEKKSR